MPGGKAPAPAASRTAAPAGARGNYRLDVENFGPIVKAGVDLRPLTIFVGPSNTGKSYLAILIYALHQSVGGLGPVLGPRGRTWFARRWMFDTKRSIDAVLLRSLRTWLAGASDAEPPADVERFLLQELASPKEFLKDLVRELRRCFGVPILHDLVRHPGRSASVVDVRVPQDSRSEDVRYVLHFGSETRDLDATVPAIPPLQRDEVGRLWPAAVDLKRQLDRAEIDFAVNEALNAVSRRLLHPLFQPAYYLPADRTGVMHSHQVVVSTLIQNATAAGLRPSADIPMLSGVLADFLNELIGISDRPARRAGHERFANFVEDDILQGAVRVERNETGYPTFSYRPRGWREDLPLMRASSMVSELAPVVLYLRHVVRPGDVLIIEEPEAHLHPGMQAAFARALARLVRFGVRVVMTTHSEWVLEQIGNLVRLSSVPEARRGDFADADAALDPTEVGAWLFKPSRRPRGSVVEEVVLDAETGLYRTDYGDVSDALYNEGARIFNRSQEDGGQ